MCKDDFAPGKHNLPHETTIAALECRICHPEPDSQGEETPNFSIAPATPNLASFRSPNHMYYVVRDTEILALCPSKHNALLILAALTLFETKSR